VKQLKSHAQLGGQAEEAGERGGNELGGDQEHEAVGQGHQAVVDQNVGLAGRIVGGDELAGESQLTAELDGAGFSVRKESGPRSRTAPSTMSEAREPPSLSRDS